MKPQVAFHGMFSLTQALTEIFYVYDFIVIIIFLFKIKVFSCAISSTGKVYICRALIV